jgi:D-glycero-D-manno-heptose 1,7-bisphosphate phosphatase
MLRYIRAVCGPRPLPALFVDRDGVLNERIVGHYVVEPLELKILEIALPSVRVGLELELPIIVISNQGGISRGEISESQVLEVNAELMFRLKALEIDLTAIYVCPHHPSATLVSDRECDCRKPAPGMLIQAARDLNIDLERSALIGDQVTDLDAGLAAGLDPSAVFTVEEWEDPEELANALRDAMVRLNP